MRPAARLAQAPPQHSHSHNHNHPRSPNEHLIQFYNGEESLFDAISSFILPSFFSSEHAAVIVATKAHLEALDLYLRQQNLVPELLRKREQMFLAPAELILEQLMPCGIVEEKTFFDYFGPLFQKLQKRYPRLLVYGELVNILCENGEHEKAHELEGVWESFLAGKDAALLCGYNLNVFSSDGLEDVFQRICRSHSHVTPAENTGSGGLLGRPEDQPMVLAMLQQKNLRLEAEMGRRAAVETALKATLDHLGTRPTDAIQIRERDGAAAHINLLPIAVMAATTIDGITDYFFNAKFLELTGLTSKSVSTDPGWVGAVHYQDRERVSRDIRLVDGKSRRLEYRFVLPDGSIRFFIGESASKESGYVHTVVDITQFRMENPLPPPPPKSRTGSIVAGLGADPNWVPSLSSGWKRSIGFSRISSPSIPTPGTGSSIFTRTHSNDQKIVQDLTRVIQLLWENIFPHPPLPNPAADPAESNIAGKLTTLYTWFRSLSRAFIPDDSAFDINNDALQKANIRLAHIAYSGSVILLSRYPLIRSIERGDLPRDTAHRTRRETTPTRRKSELDDLQYAEGCIDAAINAVQHVHSLVSPVSPSCSTTPPLAVFSDSDAGVKDVRSSRTVLCVFFVATLTVLLNISIQSEHPQGARISEGLLERISQTIADLEGLPETAEIARQYRNTLRPFVATLSSRSPSPYNNSPHPYHPQPADSTTGPLSVAGKRLTADLVALLVQPQGGIEWFPYSSPLWCWRDLLASPRQPPVGGRMIDDMSRDGGSRTLREGEGGQSPSRGTDKRARTDSVAVEDLDGEMARARETAEQWKVSKELEMLFQNNQAK